MKTTIKRKIINDCALNFSYNEPCTIYKRTTYRDQNNNIHQKNTMNIIKGEIVSKRKLHTS